MPKPTIAAVNGAAAGLGADTALSCDFVMVSPAASFTWSYVKRGLIPDGADFFAETKLDACDLEILFSAGHYVDHGFAAPGGHGFSLIPVLLAPSSRGSLRLRTADPLDPPVIDPAYLSDAADIRVLSEGIRTARQILEQPSLTRFRGAPVPGRVLDPEEHIREWGQTLYHPAGSCKLGTGPDAVVGTNLKVHGVEGLRIADASIFPNVPRAHTNAPTILVAERAAQLLRG